MNKPRAKIYVPSLEPMLDPIRSTRYMRTELYLDKDGILYNLVDDITSDELYIPINSTELLQYQEHLDGPILQRDEAVSKYPEMFI